MYAFTTKNMTCGGCAKAITRSIQAADKSALVNVLLPSRRIEVETILQREELVKLLDEAGYPVEPAQE